MWNSIGMHRAQPNDSILGSILGSSIFETAISAGVMRSRQLVSKLL